MSAAVDRYCHRSAWWVGAGSRRQVLGGLQLERADVERCPGSERQRSILCTAGHPTPVEPCAGDHAELGAGG